MESSCGICVYTYEYDLMGNRTRAVKTNAAGTVVENRKYVYNENNQLSEAVYIGTPYSRTLQMAAAYDGDGNRVFQLNYNPDKDEDFSDYYCTYSPCDYKGTSRSAVNI